MDLKAVCQTCQASLSDYGKKSKIGNFVYCDLCKAVYTIADTQEIVHPEYGPCVIGQLHLLKPGDLTRLPKPRLSDQDIHDMLRTIKDSFGPEQFKDILQERGNIKKDSKRD